MITTKDVEITDPADTCKQLHRFLFINLVIQETNPGLLIPMKIVLVPEEIVKGPWASSDWLL